MSNKPSIIFNPDYNRLVVDPLTNRLITAGEIARRNAPPAPLVKPVVANPVAAKPAAPAAPAAPLAKPVAPVAKPPAPVAKPVAPAAPVAKPAAPVAKPAAPVAKPVAPVAKPAAPVAKPAAPVAKPAAPVAKPAPAKPVAGIPAGSKPVFATPEPIKPAAKEVKFDVSASLDVPVKRYRGPTIVPAKGGYGAIILGRGRR